MKTNVMKPGRTVRAFNVVELLVLIAILAALVVVIVPTIYRAKPRAKRITCINNVKQIGLGYRLFTVDHNWNFPMAVSTLEGGSLEFVETFDTYRHFLPLSKHLGNTRILTCPADVRSPARTFEELSNTNVSYFVALNAM